MSDGAERVLVYDIFVREGILYIISNYYFPRDAPVVITVNGTRASEHGFNEYEQCRYFTVPMSDLSGSPTILSINGTEHPLVAPLVDPRARGLAIATLFKHDHPFLSNMIRYYKSLGVEDFYLYYNGHTLPEGLPTGEGIHYGLWNYTYYNHREWNRVADLGYFHNAQMTFLTMMRCKYLSDHSWMGFIDLDEYIVCSEGSSLLDALNKTQSDAVCIPHHWASLDKTIVTYSAEPLEFGKRSKMFYKGTYKGLIGVHTPKRGPYHKAKTLKLLHIQNFNHMERLGELKPPLCAVSLDGLHDVGSLFRSHPW